MIPEDAQKPVDRRFAVKDSNERLPQLQMPRQCPVLFMTDLIHPQHSLEESRQSIANPYALQLFDAWVAYAKGDIKQAILLLEGVREITKDFYGTISEGLLLAACSLWEGDLWMWQRGREIVELTKCKNETEMEIRDFWLSITDAGLVDNSHFSEWFRQCCFEKLPEDSLPAVWFYYAKNMFTMAQNLARKKIEFPEVQGKGLIRTYPYLVEPLIDRASRSGALVTEVGMRLLLAEAYQYLEEKEDALRNIERALKLALPYEMCGFLAEFSGFSGPLMNKQMEIMDDSALARVHELEKRLLDSYVIMNEMVVNRSIAKNLSPREMEVMRLATTGHSNVQIAEKLHLSVHSIKTIITSIMNKTGARKRSEFNKYII